MIEVGDFLKQILLGARAVFWVRSQVDDWCTQKISSAFDVVLADEYSSGQPQDYGFLARPC